MIKLIIDLDDTLVNSTFLNNDSYNYALEKNGFRRINSTKRITRNDINNYKKNKIIELKQKYFELPWLKYRVIINNELLKKIKKLGKHNCFLWSSADTIRRNKLLKCCQLNKYFSKIIYDTKKDISYSLTMLKKLCKNNPFLIYENNLEYFKGQNLIEYDNILNTNFDVKGLLYL